MENPLDKQVTTIAILNDHSTLPSGNSWSCQQNNANNAFYVAIPSANVNNNNKNNTYSVVPVAELDKLLDLIFIAEGDCFKNKKCRMDAAKYHYNLRAVFDLLNRLLSNTYKPTTSICFILEYPRYREVFAAKYRDRVVHHLIAPFIQSVSERVHVANGNISHGNRKQHSAQTAAEQIQGYMREYPDGVVATMDVSGFFMNIDRDMAYEVFVKFCKKYKPLEYTDVEIEWMLNILHTLVQHDPTTDCIRNSPECMWRFVPSNKSLFGNCGKGLPIGNFYSQLIANLVLAVWGISILDMNLDCKITQFVDDMCVVATNVDTVRAVRDKSRITLDELGLKLHPTKYYIQPVRHGVQFCGRVIYADRMYIGNRVVRACKNSIKQAVIRCSIKNAYRLQSSLNSYIGFMCHSRSYNIQCAMAELVNKSGYSEWVQFKQTDNHIICKVRKEYKRANVYQRELNDIKQKQYEYECSCKTKCSA